LAKGQLSNAAAERQALIENALALACRVKLLAGHDCLRVEQAIDRADRAELNLADLLSPVLEDQQRIVANITQLQKLLREIWDEGQNNRWDGA